MHALNSAKAGCLDDKAYSVPFKAPTYKYKQYASRCLYEKGNGRCLRRNVKKFCMKTCRTAEGEPFLALTSEQHFMVKIDELGLYRPMC